MKDYLRRKIDKELSDWLQSKTHSPALIYGVRQCGKSKSLDVFARKHFEYVNKIDFWKNPEAIESFDGSLEVDDIIRNLSIQFPKFRFVPNKTVLVLDEIQDCPRARLAFKSFKEDGRFEVMATGSFIGLNIVHDSEGTPKPTGSEDFFFMKTMDFEEFLWAYGYSDEIIDYLMECFNKRQAISDAIHARTKELYLEYLCIGGYPEVVSTFFKTNSYADTHKKLRSLIMDIKGDPGKRKDKEGKSLYSPAEIARIQKAFDLIASFSVAENRRFVMSKINGNGYQKDDAITYLLNASVAYKANNVQTPALPLSVKKIDSDFKLFYCDIGILVASLGYDAIRAMRGNELGSSKGIIFEAAIADSLYKANIPLFYFGKRSGLEIDFVISFEAQSTLIEAKAKTGYAKSSKTVLSHPEHYGPTRLIKFGDYNIGEEGKTLTLPHYLAFALGKIINKDFD